MGKKKIAVLFGGQSSEHEVSCVSAATIIQNIKKDNYDILLIGITKEGQWLKVDSVESVINDTWRTSSKKAILSPDTEHRGFLILDGSHVTVEKVDVIFPALHGKNGEDGTIQGLIELSAIPYVGCCVLSSAVSMDKLVTKIIVDTLQVRQAKYVAVHKEELKNLNQVTKQIEEKLPYPVFVKPSNAGSSRGISKAHNRAELEKGLCLAAEHDKKILVEEMITGRELECAVLGGTQVKASGVGEILSGAEFYDYEAKYHSQESKTILSPNLPEEVTEKIRSAAVKIFQAVDGYGLARVDFFFEEETNEIVFNEINTMPGFTSISMYPMLWEAKGLGKPQLVEKLIQLALSRQ